LSYEVEGEEEEKKDDAGLGLPADEDMKRIAVIETTAAAGSPSEIGDASLATPPVSKSAGAENDDADGGGENGKAGEDSPEGAYVRPDRIVKTLTLEGTPGRFLRRRDDDGDGDGDGDGDNTPESPVVDGGLASIYSSKSTGTSSASFASSSSASASSSNRRHLDRYRNISTPSFGKDKRGGKPAPLSETISSAWSGIGASGGKNVGVTRMARPKASAVNVVRRSRRPNNGGDGGDSDSDDGDENNGAQSQRQSQSSQSGQSQADRAKRFFARAKSILSPEDFGTVRTLLIEMKRRGDDRDGDGYLRASRKLIRILLNYEGEEEGQGAGAGVSARQGQFLELFFPLLPVKYRRSIEKMAIRMKFDLSTFREECEASLGKEDFQTICALVPILMAGAGNGGGVGVGAAELRSYLKDAERVVTVLLESEEKAGAENNPPPPTSSLLPLLPPRHRSAVRGILSGLRAKRGVARMKDAERRRMGENGVNSARFRTASQASPKKVKAEGEHAESTPEEREERMRMEEGLMRAMVVQAEKKRGLERILAAGGGRGNIIKSELAPLGAAMAKAAAPRTAAPRGKAAGGPRNPYSLSARRARQSDPTAGVPKRDLIAKSSSTEGRSAMSLLRAKPAEATWGAATSGAGAGAGAAPYRPSKRAKVMRAPRDDSGAPKSPPRERRKDNAGGGGRLISFGGEEGGAGRGGNSGGGATPLSQLDPLDRTLRQVNSAVYAKPTPRVARINRKINQNVPKNFACTVCDATPAVKPFMAECRHTACYDCWVTWLGRKEECPVCRAGTTRESLLRMVFKERGAKTPTLSQMVASDDDDDNDKGKEEEEVEDGDADDDEDEEEESDGELEVVGGR